MFSGIRHSSVWAADAISGADEREVYGSLKSPAWLCVSITLQGVAYAKTVAETMDLKLDADNPADREKLRRAILDLVAGRKMPKQKGHG